MSDVFIRYKKLPPRVGGFTVLDQDGNYNVYLNKNRTREDNLDSVDHELAHVENAHFSSSEHVRVLEKN